MKPRFEELSPKKLVGRRVRMSFAKDATARLWKGFMPARKNIKDVSGRELFSVQVYPPSFFERMDPHEEFEKWATAEVSDFADVPEDMETLILECGLYAVFLYHGASSKADSFFKYIFTEWLPESGYELDSRPHFEILGEKYKNDDPNSEEEIWIPIKSRIRR